MATLEHAVVIHANAEEVFALTQDYDRRLTWDPFLKEARLLDGAPVPAVGVRAWCVARSGWGMETEYVSFQPARVAAVRMTRGPAFLSSFAGSWRLEPLGPSETRLAFRYLLIARPRWLRPLLEPLLTLAFARDTRCRLRALKYHLEVRQPSDAPTPASSHG